MRVRVWAGVVLTVALAAVAVRASCAEPVVDGRLLDLPDCRHELVFEPVFQGDVFVFQAGPMGAPELMLVHGAGDRGMDDFAALIPALAASYRVLAFDLPGFGRSSRGNRLYSPAMYAAFLRWAADRYLHGPHTVIGHSLGGALALRYAATFPAQVERLIVADAAGLLHQVALSTQVFETRVPTMIPETGVALPSDLMRFLSNRVASRLQKLPVDMEIPLGGAAARELTLRGDPAAIASLALAQEDFSMLLDEVRAPTLLLWGADDEVTPPRTGKVLLARLANARLELIPDAGHVPMRDQPELFNRRVLRELATPAPAAGARPAVYRPRTTNRVGRCSHEGGVVFVGDYERIEIESCTGVRLLDVHAASVVVRASQVEMEGGAIAGDEVGLEVYDSLFMATATTIGATVAIQAENSRLDLAGVRLVGAEAAVRSATGATVVASLSELSTADGDSPLHGVHGVSAEASL